MVLDDRAERAECRLVGAVEPGITGAAFDQKARRLQHVQVLADRGERHVELGGDLTGGQLPVPDQLQDPQPPRRRDYPFTGRPMRGMIIVPALLATDDALNSWIDQAVTHARAAQPPRPAKRTRGRP